MGSPLDSYAGDGLIGHKIIQIDSTSYLFPCHSSVNRI